MLRAIRLVQTFRLKILKNVYEMAVTSRSEMKIVCMKKWPVSSPSMQ